MTAGELRGVLAGWPDDRPVVVAGYGRLALVTHGGSEAGEPVLVLYVAEPEPEPVHELVLTP
jgi:hypothetical protein